MKIKNDRGITLIALVITIIVLLILAGVSISMLTGENGILSQAQRAKEETENAAQKEKEDLEKLESLITGNIDEVQKVTDENPGELSGEGTSSNPYKIESIEDLVAFSSIVNRGVYNDKTYNNNSFDGQYVELSQTLDFNDNNSYGLESSLASGGLKDSLKTNGFEPIGINTNVNNNFEGNFNGNGNTIENINIKNRESIDGTLGGAGLFGILRGTVQNVSLTGNIGIETAITKQQGIGALVAMNLGTVENCNVNIIIDEEILEDGNKDIGGIVGSNLGTINKCYSKIEIEQKGKGKSTIGGIAGSNFDTISNCVSEGSITTTQYNYQVIGGIIGENVGICLNQVSDITIDVSTNNSGQSLMIGGISGLYTDNESSSSSKIEPENRIVGNCYYKGTIKVNEKYSSNRWLAVGGIIGELRGVKVENSYSNCNLESTGTVNVNLYIGVGYAEDTTIENCKYIGGDNIINAGNNCSFPGSGEENLSDTVVVNYMNSYVDSSDKNLAKWKLSNSKFVFE